MAKRRYAKLNEQQLQELNKVILSSKSKGPEVRRAIAIKLLDSNTDINVITSQTGFHRRRIFISCEANTIKKD
jgi:hypothetical protein